jgi:hypothetical protein
MPGALLNVLGASGETAGPNSSEVSSKSFLTGAEIIVAVARISQQGH